LANITAGGCAALRAHSDRKAAPRPPAPAHPRQNQYMWTLKMHAPGIRLQEHSTRCDSHYAGSFAQQRAFFAAMLPRAPLKTALESTNREKTLTVPEALFRRQSVPLSMHGCMESMAIKQYTFCARPCTAAHFCRGARTSGGLRSQKQGAGGTADERRRL
jgi:hypothetical protein